jgi:hypothetical protein
MAVSLIGRAARVVGRENDRGVGLSIDAAMVR